MLVRVREGNAGKTSAASVSVSFLTGTDTNFSLIWHCHCRINDQVLSNVYRVFIHRHILESRVKNGTSFKMFKQVIQIIVIVRIL